MKSYSKEGQDIFVSALIKENGFFLDIGCAEPIISNNTYLLQRLGWKGILIDKSRQCVSECVAQGREPAYCLDVKNIDWRAFLSENNCPKIIDYISLDVDDINIDVIQRFPFSEYEFKILTYETDKHNNNGARQTACEEVLKEYPHYDRILKDGMLDGGLIWEDWWVNTKYLNSDYMKFKSEGLHWEKFLEQILK